MFMLMYFCHVLGSLKIFFLITVVASLVLIPVNVSCGMLFHLRKEVVLSDIDKLSISMLALDPTDSLFIF
uniref:Uncharacterized protein n=1 Tax=Arundo donax TaxID=35708 RepID=A0A0A8ZCR8_ARUDO